MTDLEIFVGCLILLFVLSLVCPLLAEKKNKKYREKQAAWREAVIRATSKRG